MFPEEKKKLENHPEISSLFLGISFYAQNMDMIYILCFNL